MSCTKNLIILAALIIVFMVMSRKSEGFKKISNKIKKTISKEHMTNHLEDVVISDINQVTVVESDTENKVIQNINSNVSSEKIFGNNFTYISDEEKTLDETKLESQIEENTHLKKYLDDNTEIIENEEINNGFDDKDIGLSEFIYNKEEESEPLSKPLEFPTQESILPESYPASFFEESKEDPIVTSSYDNWVDMHSKFNQEAESEAEFTEETGVEFTEENIISEEDYGYYASAKPSVKHSFKIAEEQHAEFHAHDEGEGIHAKFITHDEETEDVKVPSAIPELDGHDQGEGVHAKFLIDEEDHLSEISHSGAHAKFHIDEEEHSLEKEHSLEEEHSLEGVHSEEETDYSDEETDYSDEETDYSDEETDYSDEETDHSEDVHAEDVHVEGDHVENDDSEDDHVEPVTVPTGFGPIEHESDFSSPLSIQTLDEEIESYKKKSELPDQNVEAGVESAGHDSAFFLEKQTEEEPTPIYSEISPENNKVMDHKSEKQLKHRFKDQVKTGTFIDPVYEDRMIYASVEDEMGLYEPTGEKIKKNTKSMSDSMPLRQFYNESIPTFKGNCTAGEKCELAQKGVTMGNCLTDYGLYDKDNFFQNASSLGRVYDNDACFDNASKV